MIVCGTGHRPDKLGGYDEATYQRLVQLATEYLRVTKHDAVISGMALGWDQALAEAALDLCIPVKAYIPFMGMENKWPASSQMKYHALLRRIPDDDWVVCSEGGYAPWKMQKRNEDMVNDSDYVLALWNGSTGGTHNCIAYAQKKQKQIVNLWEKYAKLRTDSAS
jgi:uncharacterized phage-like protein YoqJ